MQPEKRQGHNQKQIEYFDERAHLWKNAVPADIQERTAYIVNSSGVNSQSMILDVGTGSGVLIGHFLASGARQSNVVGCDLSQQMLKLATTRFHDVFFWRGDVMEFSFKSPMPSGFPDYIKGFSHVFFNACFANMLDRRAVLEHSSQLLPAGGKVVISHPAPEFVSALHASDPEIVPHLLPTREEASSWANELNVVVEHFESVANLYLAIFERRE